MVLWFPYRVIRPAAVVVLLVSLLLASACGGGDSSPAGAPATGSSAPSASPAPSAASSAARAPGEAFCTGFEANGGGLASIGEPPVFYPKEGLVTYAQETLAVMKGLTPPREIAKEWTAYGAFHTRLLTEAQALGAGQRLGRTLPGRAELAPAYKKINTWITANC